MNNLIAAAVSLDGFYRASLRDKAAVRSYSTMVEFLDMPINSTDVFEHIEATPQMITRHHLGRLVKYKRNDGLHVLVASHELCRELDRMEQGMYSPVIDGMIVPSNHVPDDTILLVHIKQGKVTCLAKLTGMLP